MNLIFLIKAIKKVKNEVLDPAIERAKHKKKSNQKS